MNSIILPIDFTYSFLFFFNLHYPISKQIFQNIQISQFHEIPILSSPIQI